MYAVGENSPMIGVSSFIHFIAQLLQYLRQRVRWAESFPQLVCWFWRSVHNYVPSLCERQCFCGDQATREYN